MGQDAPGHALQLVRVKHRPGLVGILVDVTNAQAQRLAWRLAARRAQVGQRCFSKPGARFERDHGPGRALD